LVEVLKEYVAASIIRLIRLEQAVLIMLGEEREEEEG
jgi:hypothetical protein